MTIDVYLAPGHGRHPDTGHVDEGARDGNATEQRDGDLICRAAQAHLEQHYGLTVYRQPRGGPDFRGTIPDILNRAPRVAIEVHHDWNKAPRGGFGFWRTDNQRALADAIHTAYRDAGLPTRPHMQHLPGTSSYPAIVRRTHAVLWEADRIGAVNDHRLYGRVLADGIARYLNIDPEDLMTPEQEAKLDDLLDRVSTIETRVTWDLPRLRRGVRGLLRRRPGTVDDGAVKLDAVDVEDGP